MGIGRLIEVQLMVANELASLLYVLEIQAVPIEHRATPQDEAHSLQIVQSEVVNGLQPLPAVRGWWRRAGMPCISVDGRS